MKLINELINFLEGKLYDDVGSSYLKLSVGVYINGEYTDKALKICTIREILEFIELPPDTSIKQAYTNSIYISSPSFYYRISDHPKNQSHSAKIKQEIEYYTPEEFLNQFDSINETIPVQLTELKSFIDNKVGIAVNKYETMIAASKKSNVTKSKISKELYEEAIRYFMETPLDNDGFLKTLKDGGILTTKNKLNKTKSKTFTRWVSKVLFKGLPMYKAEDIWLKFITRW